MRMPILTVLAVLTLPAFNLFGAKGGQLTLRVVDRESNAPISCRVHLKNGAGKPLKAAKAPFFADHFVIDGEITLKLPKGNYTFEMERGCEYLPRVGHFEIKEFAEDEKTVDLLRIANLASLGWYAGDLDIERPATDIELFMKAEDLYVGQLIDQSNRKALVGAKPGGKLNAAGKSKLSSESPVSDSVQVFDGNRYLFTAASLDDRSGSGLALLYPGPPLTVPLATELAPFSWDWIAAARGEKKAWTDAQHAYAWDLPVWVAKEQVDSIELAFEALGRSTSKSDFGGGRPGDKTRFGGPQGTGRWSAAIYYHLLNCGLRIPPSAGSGSGSTTNPLGYNRVYVHLDGEISRQAWWDGLRAGRSVITNGPLLLPSVEGELPSHTFQADAGQTIELNLGLTLHTRDKISYLEVIKNGKPAFDVRLDAFAKAGGRLPKVKFDASGWFVIRAVADNNNTYRFATTAPYYVEIGYKKHISRKSAEFFVAWCDERLASLADDRTAQKDTWRETRAFWQGLADKATAE